MRSMRTLFLLLVPLAAACGVAPPEAVAEAGTQIEAPALAVSTVTSPGSLALSISADPQGTDGTPLVVTVTVQNTSALDASGTQLSFSVPPGSQIGGRLPLECLKTRNYLVACSVGALPGLSGYSFPLTVTPEVPGPFYASAFTSASFSDGSSDSNSVQAVIEILPAATDLQVGGSASTGSPPAGATFNYTFQVKNSGPRYASGISFAGTVAAELSRVRAFTSASGGACTVSGAAIDCQLGDLPVGGQASVTVYAVAPLTPGTYDASATVATAWGDPKPANDAVTVTVRVK